MLALAVPFATACGAGRGDETSRERTTPYVANGNVGDIRVADAIVAPTAGACPPGADCPAGSTPTAAATASAAVPPSSVNAQGFLTVSLLNRGSQPDVFTGAHIAGGTVSVAGAAAASPSATPSTSGASPTNSTTLPPGELVSFGDPFTGAVGPALVITGLAQPLQNGTVLSVTFSFAQAGDVTLAVPVQPITGTTQSATPIPVNGGYPPESPTTAPSASG
jgi:hypothetical protein